MLVMNERVTRASGFEILASPDPAVPHRILDQFTNLNLSPSRFTVRRANALTVTIQVLFEEIDGKRARRICGRLRPRTTSQETPIENNYFGYRCTRNWRDSRPSA